MNHLQKLLSASFIGATVAGASPASAQLAFNTSTPFQIVDQTDESCMNTVAWSGYPFIPLAFNDTDHDGACSKEMRDIVIKNNKHSRRELRAFADQTPREPNTQLPTVAGRSYERRFGLSVLGFSFFKADPHEDSIRETGARDILASSRGNMNADIAAIAIYKARNSEMRQEIIDQALRAQAEARSGRAVQPRAHVAYIPPVASSPVGGPADVDAPAPVQTPRARKAGGDVVSNCRIIDEQDGKITMRCGGPVTARQVPTVRAAAAPAAQPKPRPTGGHPTLGVAY